MAKRGFQGAVLKVLRAREYPLAVVERSPLTPSCVRVVFSAPELLGAVPLSAASWLRLWVPDPERPDVEHQRGYTIAAHDARAGTIAVDFVQHEPLGPASTWAARAEAGDRIGAMSMGSTEVSFAGQDQPEGYLMIGDAASVPAIRSLVAEAPAHVPVRVYLEEHSDSDRDLPFASHPCLDVRWVPREGPESLARAIAPGDYQGWCAWATPEFRSLRALKPRLKEWGLAKGRLHAQAYWIEGRGLGRSRGEKR